MKKFPLVLVLLASPALAQDAGRAHPLAPECSVTDADCIAQHDSRILTLAINLGHATYCRASTAPSRCTETLEMVNGDYVPAVPECATADAPCIAAREDRVLTLALNTGDARYCKSSTRPAACNEAVEVITGDYVPVETPSRDPMPVKMTLAVKATPTPAAKLTPTPIPHGARVVDLSGPAESEADLPDLPTMAKKAAL